MQRIMSPNIHQRRVSASFKLPPDLEKNIENDLAAGKYSCRSDAYVSIMREYYRIQSEDRILQRISDLEKRVAELETKE